jgi:hypothetical protein
MRNRNMNAHSSIAHLPSTAASFSHRGTKSQRGDAELFADQLDGKRTPPAQAARAALEERPDLAGRPFGAIVSLLARNRELPAPADATPAEPSVPDDSVTPSDTAGDAQDQDSSAEPTVI